jgi:hypothetical protein
LEEEDKKATGEQENVLGRFKVRFRK